MPGLRRSLVDDSSKTKTMGEMGEKELGSTLFDLEMDEVTASHVSGASLHYQLIANQHRLAPLLQPRETSELRVARDVCWFNHTTVKEDGKHDTIVLASKLVNIGYKVAVRTAMGGGPGQDCFHNLHHEFLVVSEPDQEIFIDCHFKDQFRIGHHTQQYQQVLRCLPEVFVGSAVRLAPLVELLCSEMGLAFKEQGATCPPWRQVRSMISKWLPTKAQDTLVGRNSACIPQVQGTSSDSVSSDDEFDALLDSGVSPTGPLPSYFDDGGAPKSWSKVEAQPFVTLTGFKVKSLLSSGLAAIHSHKPGQPTWQQPAIRTVRMTGRPLMQAQAV